MTQDSEKKQLLNKLKQLMISPKLSLRTQREIQATYMDIAESDKVTQSMRVRVSNIINGGN